MTIEVSEAQIPCIVDKGIIFNKRDMLRVLHALDQVEYVEIIEGTEEIRREGFIVEIFEDGQQATVLFNRRLHLNVNSFEYLRINYDAQPEKPVSHCQPKPWYRSALDLLLRRVTQADPSSQQSNKIQPYSIELYMGNRCIKLFPKGDPLQEPSVLISEVEERRRAGAWVQITEEVEDYDD